MNSSTNPISNFTAGITLRTGIIISIILVLLLCAVILLTASKHRKRLNIGLAITALGLFAFTLVCAVYFTGSGIILLHTNGNPSASVEHFYSLMLEGNYPEGYKYLKDYSTLGLENAPSDAYSEQIYDALKKSYSYELVGEADINEFNAAQTVRFSYLEITAISDNISSRIDELLEERIDSLPWHQIYDDNGNYRTDLLDEVYDTAFEEAMKNVEAYTVTTEYTVGLEYVGDSWMILVNDDMTYCFAGGTR